MDQVQQTRNSLLGGTKSTNWKIKMKLTRKLSAHTELVGGIPTPLKNMSSSVGMMKFPTISGKS